MIIFLLNKTKFRNALGYKIVGYPVRIEHQRYTRNAFYFNLCFVCDSWARTVQYEPIVRKLSEYFVSAIDVHLEFIVLSIELCHQ